MNTIKVYLDTSGRVASLDKNFPLYQYQFQNVLLNVLVPTEILAPFYDVQHFIGSVKETSSPNENALTTFVESKKGEIELYDTVYWTDTSDDNEVYYACVYTTDIGGINQWTWREVAYFNSPTTYGTNIKIGSISVARNGQLIKSKSYACRYLKTVTIAGAEYAMYERKMPKSFSEDYGDATLVVNVVNVNENGVESIITSQKVTLPVLQSTLLDVEEHAEPSELDNINAEINAIKVKDNEQDVVIGSIQGDINRLESQKQNKLDNSLQTTAKTIVGAINELKTGVQENVDGILENRERISQNETDIAELQAVVVSGENYVGSFSGETSPTPTELNEFVLEETGRTVKYQDVVFFTLEIVGETDITYKYFYTTNGWKNYPVPSFETASNTDKGIVKGTFGTADYSELVDIVNGEIVAIYVKVNGSYKRLSQQLVENVNSISSLQSGLSAVQGDLSTYKADLASGVKIVAKANADGDGNVITNTYLNKTQGATKAYVKDYALPTTFNNVNYLDLTEELSVWSDTQTDGNKEVTLSSVGYNDILETHFSVRDKKFQLSKNNRYKIDYKVSMENNESVIFRLETYIKKAGDEPFLANVEVSEQVDFVSSAQLKTVSFADAFKNIEEVFELVDGDEVYTVLSAFRTISASNIITVWSNEAYSSTFYLQVSAMVVTISTSKKGEVTVVETAPIIETEDIYEAPFEFQAGEEFTDNAEYIFIIPFNDGLDKNTSLYLKHDNIDYPLVTPYNNTTATIELLKQTLNSNYNFRVPCLYRDGVFYAEMDNLAFKTEKIRIDINPELNVFLRGEEEVNFAELNALLQYSPDFVVFVYDKREHRCTLIDLESNPKQMRFIAPILSEGLLKAQSIYVTSNDGVEVTEMTVSNINSENVSNKVTSITDSPTNTQYPSAKAIKDYFQAKIFDPDKVTSTKVIFTGDYGIRALLPKTYSNNMIHYDIDVTAMTSASSLAIFNFNGLAAAYTNGQDLEYHFLIKTGEVVPEIRFGEVNNWAENPEFEANHTYEFLVCSFGVSLWVEVE